jgi:hypothetical protein
MREIIVRVACFVVNLAIGEPRLVVTEAQERELALARINDPYFDAFKQRCMQWVSGDDPRRPPDGD